MIAAGGEVGSGTALASGLKHFDDCAPHAENVQKESVLSGARDVCEVLLSHLFSSDRQVLPFSARIPASGLPPPLPELEASMEAALTASLSVGKQVVFHVVVFSKTGIQQRIICTFFIPYQRPLCSFY